MNNSLVETITNIATAIDAAENTNRQFKIEKNQIVKL